MRELVKQLAQSPPAVAHLACLETQSCEASPYDRLLQKHLKLEFSYKSQHLKLIDYKQKARYWKAQHKRAVEREEKQKQEHAKIVEKLEAKNRKLNHQLFGKRSEQSKGKPENKPTTENVNNSADPNSAEGYQKKKRGQQSNNKGPSRRDYSHLAEEIEVIDFAEGAKQCSYCGLAYEELPGYEPSDIIELVEVQAHVRKIKRNMYKRHASCQCSCQPKIIVAPTAARLFPKTRFGISIWRHLLLEKFHYQRPIERALRVLTNQGLALSSGTITDGFKRIMPLFFPIYNAIQSRSLEANHWHADETRWEVYEETEGKASSRWYLWIFKSKDTVIFKVSPTRSAQVPRDFFKLVKAGFLSVDRYVAYKCIANEGVLILAFCWAHVRRDFLDYAKSYPEDDGWAMDWIDEIANLYHINNQRIFFEPKSDEFKKYDATLRDAENKMQEKYKNQLSDKNIKDERKAILTSLDNHWSGLIVFITHSFIPMDNNKAENGLRPGVLARKAFYGSRAVWSATLLVLLMSIFQTMQLWGINVHRWLDAYLTACAENNGAAPNNINCFLPWNMSGRRLRNFQKPITYEDSS